MKPLSAAKWKVLIASASDHNYWWAANSKDSPLHYGLVSDKNFRTTRSAKQSWLRFAKLNKFKNWEWEE